MIKTVEIEGEKVKVVLEFRTDRNWLICVYFTLGKVCKIKPHQNVTMQ